ncbi:MAG: hypothetical protein HYR90_04990 [Candidatus Andersenbacteria bacterium]|nr:hypothetical protein [Candidatus Andersenbacteria bacterium]MBI3250755.1 hypothetical protein [Candidatus Andersenbacteria bacterium]
MRRYFAVIVHYTSPRSTFRLVEALGSSSARPDFTVIVDHADIPYDLPTDKTVIVKRQSNKGYVAGLTVGLKVIQSLGGQSDDVVICLNNDVEISSGTMKGLREWAESRSNPFLAGDKLGVVNLFTGRAHLPPMPEILMGKQYVHGSVLVAPLHVFQVTQLPLGLYMYWEDVVFSWSVSKAGIPLLPLPRIGITHNDAVEPLPPLKKYYLVRNGAYVLENYTSSFWRVYWKALNSGRYLYHRLSGHTDLAQALVDRKSIVI